MRLQVREGRWGIDSSGPAAVIPDRRNQRLEPDRRGGLARAVTRHAAPLKRSSSVRNAGYLVGSQVVAIACMFGVSILLARALGPSGKGYYDIAVGSARLLMAFLGLSMASGIFFYASKGNIDHRRLLLFILAAVLLQGVVATGVLLEFRDHSLVAWMLPEDSRIAGAVLIGGLLVVLQAQQLVRAVATGRGRFGAFGLSEVMSRVGALFAVIILVLVGLHAPEPFIMAYAVAMLVAVIFLFGTVWRVPTTDRSLPLMGIVAYSLPLFLGNIVQFMNYRLDIFFLKGYLGLDAVGKYTVAVSLAQILWLIPSALASLVMRATAEHEGRAYVLRRIAEVTRFCLCLSVMCGIGLLVAAGLTLTAVFGKDFQGSIRPLLLLVPGVVLFCPAIILSAYLNGIRKQAYTTWVACGSLVLTVILNILLIPRIGIEGAALASSAAYTLSSAATVYFVLHLNPGLPLAMFFLPQQSDVRRTADFARAWLVRLRTSRLVH